MLIVILIIAQTLTTVAYANTSTAISGDENIINILETSHDQSIIHWQLDLKKLSNNIVKLSIEGSHQLDLIQVTEVFKAQGIEITQPDPMKPDYLLKVSDITKTYSIEFQSTIMEQTTDYRITAETLYNDVSIKATDGVYQLIKVTGNLTYQKVPAGTSSPDTVIYLVNTATNEMVQKQIVPASATQYIFSDVRKFDDAGKEIVYTITTQKLGTYETTISKYDITQTYLNADIKGTITNPESQPLELKLFDKATNQLIDTQTVTGSETSYTFLNAPLNDPAGQPVQYEVQVTQLAGYQIEVTGYDIAVTKEASTEAPTTETPKTEVPATEAPTTEMLTTEMPLTEAPTTETSTTATPTTEAPTVQAPTTSTSTTQSSVIKTPTKTARTMTTFSLAPTSTTSTLTASPSYAFNTVKYSYNGILMTMTAVMNSTNTSIDWTISISNKSGKTSNTIDYNNWTLSTGLGKPTSFSYYNGATGGTAVNKTWATNQTLTSYSANVNTIKFTTPITTSGLTSYKFSISPIYVDTWSNGSGIWGEFLMRTNTPAVNAVSSSDTKVTGTAVGNSTVTIKDANGNILGTTTADASGNYTVTIPKQAAGTVLNVTAKASNLAESTATQVTVTQSAVAPDAPVITNEVMPYTTALKGTAEPNMTIEATLPNGTKVTGKSDASGNFSLTIPVQTEGAKILVAAISPNGLRSNNTTVTVQKMATTTISKIDSSQVGVVGTADPFSIVTLTDANGNVLGTTKASADGTYYIDLYKPLPAGTVLYAQAKMADGTLSNKATTTVVQASATTTPGTGTAIIEPNPTYVGSISNMSWDERGLYRNRVPQPVEYNEGYLWKYAKPTSVKNQYAIDLKTQGRSTVSQQPLDIVLVVDNSGSMDQIGSNGMTRWENLKASVNSFIDEVMKNNSTGTSPLVRIGVVNYAQNIISQKTFSADPAVVKGAIPASPSYGSQSGTFTQLGERTGAQMLATSPNKQVMIVLTDGAPTLSYKGTAGTGPEDMTAFSTLIKGSGWTYLLDGRSEPGYDHNAYTLNGFTVTNHGQPTISEAKLIKKNNPGFTVFSVGIDTNVPSAGATTDDMNKVLTNIASKPEYAFQTTDSATQLSQILSNISQIMSDSISKGVVTDPIGPMYDLDLGSNGVFDSSDYTLTASDPSLLIGVTVTYDAATRTIKINGLTLGKGEWVNLNYKVNLRTTDSSFVENQWYPMNGKTTLQPTPTSTLLREYPVPEAKYAEPVYSFTFNKVDDKGNTLANATFSLKNNSGVTVTQTSDASGLVSFANLKTGTYTLNETAAPAGYTMDTATHTVNIGSDGSVTVDGKAYTSGTLYKIINTKILGKLDIVKYQAGDESKLLAGATFDLKDSTGHVIASRTTGTDGKISFIDLPLGTYTLVEAKAPTGYQLDQTPINVTIKDGTLVTVKVSNKSNSAILPNTGGWGTLLFTFSGIIIIFLSLMYRRQQV
ncbi:SpaA isopeptide-forming pilin-related protein [Macrococcus bovicus]|uniref:SpaA isopeptide-forming pilin-related protein n=1 Tax=Macrococcus bovicus TaxID=69968 RepID=UPI0025A580D7|nr:SpaA isopeptide-forming pilin-related protein [Macrococcus bovicus]WJP98192.1 SpaA isopeptide-forming pilin-related protein [Macrococcus bovicus]